MSFVHVVVGLDFDLGLGLGLNVGLDWGPRTVGFVVFFGS